MTSPMSYDELDAIRERLAAGSKGAPWFWEVATHRRWTSVLPSLADERERLIAQCVDDDIAEFIAHSPADIAALLAEVERLRGELDGMTAEWKVANVDPRLTGLLELPAEWSDEEKARYIAARVGGEVQCRLVGPWGWPQ